MTSLNPPDRTMRRVLLGLAVFFAILAACLMWSALDASRASALSYGACYEDREETWLEFERTIVVQEEVVELEHQLAKHTRERTQESIAGWQRYSFTKPGGWKADTPPPGPDVKPEWWQANVAGDPHGVGQEGAYFRSNGNSGKGDWFYLESTQTPGPWSDWSEPVLYEPMSHETWVTEIPEPNWQPHASGSGWERQWALLPTGYADTVVVTPEVTETETEWFASPPEDDWTPTGNARTEIIEVEVSCPDPVRGLESSASHACDTGITVTVTNTGEVAEIADVNGVRVELPVGATETVTFDPVTDGSGWVVYVGYDAGGSIVPTDVHEGMSDCPTVDESFEAEADHTDPPAQPVEEVETSSISTERRTLPRTGIKEDIASVGLVLLFVGGSLLGLEAYDRRKRRA